MASASCSHRLVALLWRCISGVLLNDTCGLRVESTICRISRFAASSHQDLWTLWVRIHASSLAESEGICGAVALHQPGADVWVVPSKIDFEYVLQKPGQATSIQSQRPETRRSQAAITWHWLFASLRSPSLCAEMSCNAACGACRPLQTRRSCCWIQPMVRYHPSF